MSCSSCRGRGYVVELAFGPNGIMHGEFNCLDCGPSVRADGRDGTVRPVPGPVGTGTDGSVDPITYINAAQTPAERARRKWEMFPVLYGSGPERRWLQSKRDPQ